MKKWCILAFAGCHPSFGAGRGGGGGGMGGFAVLFFMILSKIEVPWGLPIM